MNERIAVVTGASRGIGYAIARELALRGLRVIAASRTSSAVPDAEPFALDVARPETIAALAARLHDGLDVLVNNAGISMHGFNAKVARETLDVNFTGALRVSDALLPRMRRGGRVVMVSSGMGELSSVSPELRTRLLDPALTKDELVALMQSFVHDVETGVHEKHGWPSSAYRVSKVGLNALTRILARDLRDDPRKILLNAACPGWVRTQMGGPGAPRSPEEGARTPTWLALLPEGGPTGGFFRDKAPIPW